MARPDRGSPVFLQHQAGGPLCAHRICGIVAMGQGRYWIGTESEASWLTGQVATSGWHLFQSEVIAFPVIFVEDE